MREFAKPALLAIAIVVGALSPSLAQSGANGRTAPPVVTHPGIAPLGWFVMGSVAAGAVSPMIASAILGRELTLNEAYRAVLGGMLGPVGWLLADALAPPTQTGPNIQQPTPPRKPKQVTSGRNINIPPPGETRFVTNEILLELAAGMSARDRTRLVSQLQLTPLQTQTFDLTLSH